jgi:integrase
VVCLRSGLRPSLRHTTRTVPQLSHEHWYKNWGAVNHLTMKELGMASISREPNGAKTIQFVDGDKRRSIRLGKFSDKAAQSVRAKVESILAASASGQPLDQETAAWLGRIDDKLHNRLVRAGLVQPRQEDTPPVTLGQFLDAYFSSLGPQKPNTARNNLRARRLLEEYLGTGRTLISITEGDGDAYRNWLLKEKKLAKSGIGRDIGRAKTFFKAATRRRLIPASPFAHVQCPSQINPSRKHYIPLEVIAKVIAACPDNEWRLIFAFARFAGLRIPSEIEGLKWSDIHWEASRFTVNAHKVAHHAGHETRSVPIFPQLRPYLEAAHEELGHGCEYVVPRAKDGPNLRRYAQQIIKRAGVPQWPKLFVNCRASCEKDLMEGHRPDAVLGWIGHSARVALQHYAPGPTETDYQKAVQNPVHSTAAVGHQEPSSLHVAREKSLDVVKVAETQYPRQGSNL